MSAIPPRVRWAVDIIAPAGDDHLLELGCGPGAAAALVCARLTTGHLLAVDRSPVAVARTRERNAASVAAGRLTVRQSTIAGLLTPRAADPLPAPEPRVAGPRSADPRATDPRLASPSPARDPSSTPVDTVFAVNVNVFWTTDAVQELSVLRQLLRPGGELFVLYGAAPTGSRSATPVVATALAANGFGDLTILETTSGSGVRAIRRP